MPIFDYALIAMFIASAAILGVMIYLFWRSSERMDSNEQKQSRIVTVIKCSDGSEKTREYREGDYVGLGVEDCAGGVVVGIYRESQQK